MLVGCFNLCALVSEVEVLLLLNHIESLIHFIKFCIQLETCSDGVLFSFFFFALSSPESVIQRFEQRAYAVDSRGVVEYLRALLATNAIAEYLPDEQSGKPSSLPSLVLGCAYFFSVFNFAMKAYVISINYIASLLHTR